METAIGGQAWGEVRALFPRSWILSTMGVPVPVARVRFPVGEVMLVVCKWMSWLVLALSAGVSGAQEFRVLAWNVESNRPNQPPVSDAGVIAEQLTALLQAPATRSQLIALSEVEPKTLPVLIEGATKGLGSEIDIVTSASGGFEDTDSLALLVDRKRFAVEEAIELHRFAGIAANFNVMEADSDDLGALRARSPLAVRLLDRESNVKFWLIVNHLARGEEDLRTDQARMLVKWAAAHPEPVIAAGDFNFDYDFRTAQGNAGYQAMMEGNVWSWVKPDPLVDSNWSTDRNITDRKVDRYPDSLLDFIFVANQAREWQGTCTVIVRDGDFPDDNRTSDHRPILGVFQPK